MNKRQLIEKVAQKNGTTKTEATKAVNAVIESMVETLKSGENISLLEFGSFTVKDRPQRNGYNPSNNTSILIPAKRVVKFSTGKYFFDNNK